MATNFQAINQTLENIKGSLIGLRDNVGSATEAQREQLGGALNTLGSTLSSTEARTAVSNAQRNTTQSPTRTESPTIDPLIEAQQARAQAEARAKNAEAKMKEAEATASISDQRLLKKTGATAGATGSPASQTQTGATALNNILASEPQLADYGLNENNVDDPMVVASLRYQAAREGQIANDVNILNEYVARREQRVKDQVALIDQSIANQNEQLKVEQRKRMASTSMAGILSGRSLYSPEEHQGLIQEVIQEGILQLQEIQLEGYKLQNEMWSDFEDFEFEAYTQKSEMLKEFNRLELETVTTIQERLQEVAKIEREKQLFDQSQMERTSLILAEELVGASDEEIRQTAEREGVDYGMLLRAVRDSTFTEQDRSLTLAGKQQSLISARNAEARAAAASAAGGTSGLTESEQAEIDTYAQEMIDNRNFNITSVPQAIRAAVIARRNELQGDADTAEFIETGGDSFVDWINEDKKRSKFVKSQFADKMDSPILPFFTDKAGSHWLTPRGVDVRRAINSNEGQTAVQIAIEQGARTNEDIYNALFGDGGIIIEYVNEEIERKNRQEDSVQKTANSTPAIRN